MSLLRASVLALLAAGCASRQPPPAPTSPDLAAGLPDDPRLLLAAAREDCGPLSTPAGRRRGIEAAARASQLDPGRDSLLALSRCCFSLADWADTPEHQAAYSSRGMEAARLAGAPEDPEAAYYLALNQGLRLQHEGLSALGQVKDVIAALESARAQPSIDQGGPLRVLGMLYLRAPSWPTGPGDLEAALELLREAAAKYPEHPLNHLFLAEALKQAGEPFASELDEVDRLATTDRWGDYAARWKSEAAALGR